MPRSELSDLQRRVLVALAGTIPAWTLTGGGALAGVHFGHRTTRDLDLFWRGLSTLGGVPRAIEARLVDAGMQLTNLQTEPAFRQYRVEDAGAVVIVDLVADPVPTIEPPMIVRLGASDVQVDSPHEIFVNKLCALLGRAEVRDLIDVRVLLDAGFDLGRALDDAPKKDAGFSPLTLAWVLEQQALEPKARAYGLDDTEVSALVAFRDRLSELVLERARPSESPPR
jgi:hypothetical protein